MTNITIGNGTIACAYQRVGRKIDARYQITWGSTTSGSGTATFALPVAAHAIYAINSCIGQANVVAGGVEYGGWTATIITGATTFGLSNASGFVSESGPGLFTTGDLYSIHITYEAAS